MSDKASLIQVLLYIILAAQPAILTSQARADSLPPYPGTSDIFPHTICGKDDLQHVYEFESNESFTAEWVAHLKSSVGALYDEGRKRHFCSGTLISEDLFLTASHCVTPDSATDWQPDAVSFQYELGEDGEILPVSRYKVMDIVENNRNLDYAILKLDGFPGVEWGVTPVNLVPPLILAPIAIIQHPKGEPKQVDTGNIRGFGWINKRVRYGNLDTRGGTSGSGILDVTGALIGVHTNGGCRARGGSNFGTPLFITKSKILEDLAKQ